METAQGLKVTTQSMDVIDSINHFHHHILSAGSKAGEILDAAPLNPDNLLIQAYAAAFYLYAQRNDAIEIAKTFLKQAELNLRQANERELLTYQALKAWADNDLESAISIFSAIAKLYPKDTLALKFAEWLFYCCGQAFNGKKYLSLCEQVKHINQNDPYFLACYSFALELSGDYQESEKVAENAMTLETISPWAHHTIAHIYFMTNRLHQGQSFLENNKATWTDINPLLKGHNTWHLALFYLANRNEKKVVELYQNVIWLQLKETVLAQVDAISLLWRMDLAGLPQTNLMQEVYQYLNHHPYEFSTGFNALHFIYCLARLGDTKAIDQALNDMQNSIEANQPGYMLLQWQTITYPFCRAIAAFCNEDHETVYKLLQPRIKDCFQLGGSDAQCELFLQTYYISLIKCQREKESIAFYQQYLSHYKGTPIEAYWLS